MTRTEILLEALQSELDCALAPDVRWNILLGHVAAARTIAFNLGDDITGKFGIKPRHTLIAEESFALGFAEAVPNEPETCKA